MFTLTNLPKGKLYAFVTATRVNFDDAEDGVAETGWVDWSLSNSTLFESRNDVRPLLDEDTHDILNGRDYGAVSESPQEMREDIVRQIRDVLGHVDSSERGTLYASDHQTLDYTTADTWSYAVHVMVKHLHDGQWTESPVHIPAEDVNA